MKKLLKKRVILEQVPKVAEGVAPSNPLNISVNQSALIMAKVKTQHDAFLTMCNSERFPIEQTIINWWPAAFGEPFPSDYTLSVQECKVRIQYQLMYLGYNKNGVNPPERFNVNYKKYFEGTPDLLRQCENENLLSKTFINPKQFLPEEDSMSVSKKASVVTTDAPAKKAVIVASTASKAVKAPKPVVEKSTKKTIGQYIGELLTAERYLDEEIVKMVVAEFPGTNFKNTSDSRSKFNRGVGYPVPPNVIEKIVEVDGKRYKKSEVPKAEKKSRTKVDPANDPLKQIAGIDTTKKSVTTAKAPKPPVQAPDVPAKKVAVKKVR